MIVVRGIWRGWAAAVLPCLLAACGAVTHNSLPPVLPAAAVSVWASSVDQTRKLQAMPSLPLAQAGPEDPSQVVIDPARPAQRIVGFGAAMTDSSAHLFQNGLLRPERDALFSELFGPTGLGLGFLRVPIGASDFSLEHYSLDDLPTGQSDPELARFSMTKADAMQVPALLAAKVHNPGMVLMASPWSAPGWMKSSGSLIQGRLKPEHYGAFARYFVRYLDAMEARGLPVSYVSMQNEPDFEPADYPGMKASPAERAAFIGGHLGPALAARKTPVGILEWDHNWDKPEQPLAVLGDPVARKHLAGVAWHCYAGDPGVMASVKAAYPDMDLFFTECSGGDWAPDWGGSLEWMTDSLIIAPIKAGARGSVLWNLALDEQAGPHLGGCGNCRAVVTINSRTRAVTRNVEYYVLGHVSRFVRPGAHAIHSSGGPAGLKFVAFGNPDGSLVLLAHNSTRSELPVSVNAGTGSFRFTAPAGEVMTFVWRKGHGTP